MCREKNKMPFPANDHDIFKIVERDDSFRGKDKHKPSRNWRALGIAILLILTVLAPSEVLAIQTHGMAEGLYAHQFGHALFLGAMVVLYFRLRHQVHLRSRGWKFISLSCLLFAMWNAVAFLGHWLEESLSGPIFSGGDPPWERSLVALPEWKALIFYACKFDHLLAVPAMIFFLLGLREFCKERQ